MANEWYELLMTDHETTEKVFDAMTNAFQNPQGPPAEMVVTMLEYFTAYVDNCHNKKEENHLFPLIERRGIPRTGGPLAVMLAEHEQSRDLLERLVPVARAYVAGDRGVLDALRKMFEEYAALLKSHYWKENDILYPMARRVMSETDVPVILDGIEATEAALGHDTRAKYYAMAARIIEGGALQDLSFNLDRDVLAAMINTLPVEISFIDQHDRVRYFSHENHAKIFPRTRGAIGVPVQECHPQKSLHMVNAILRDFKAGTREVAEFWIDMAGRKIHIRYFPVRGAKGEYVGCMEVVQDITGVQKLTGERRLLSETQ
ncbi:MAG: DUF438 domain-containing protein [Planctomycetes bacterium]|nr:DUF438 domain-containing protein [Planctomycetota bacterium]